MSEKDIDVFARNDCRGHISDFDVKNMTFSHMCTRDTDGEFRLRAAHTVSEQACLTCPHYKSRYIAYPIEVDKIETEAIDFWHPKDRIPGTPVAVRPADSETTYLGFYLGELPWFMTAKYDEKNKILSVIAPGNPAMLVPALGKIIRGAESWWHILKSPEDFKQITDKTIDSQWYVQMAKDMLKKGADNAEKET